MADSTPAARPRRPRPGENMKLVEALQYRLPLAGIVSILHRGSGLLMFVLLPFVIWLLDRSLTSEISYDEFASVFVAGLGPFPAFLVKLVVLALLWAIFHHAIAGLRHVWMDISHQTSKEQGRQTALITLVASVVLTILAGLKLFGVF